VLEKLLLAWGALFGLASGALFYHFLERLSLPGLLYALVDLLGPAATAAMVGLIAGLIGMGLAVLAIGALWPEKPPEG
jgi:hypothetical protein